MQNFLGRYAPIIFLLCFFSCSPKKKNADDTVQEKHTVVVGIGSDIGTINPVFAQEVTGGEIGELIYSSLVEADFDTTTGVLRYTPMLAREWESANDRRDIIFHLRTDAVWSDSIPVTARDVQFSYELYGDESLGSVRQHELEDFRRGEDGKIDIRHSVDVINDSTVIFHFQRYSPSQLYDAGMPILPSHILDTIPRAELRTHTGNRKPVGSGPFALESWKPGDEITLVSNKSSVLPYPARLDRLVFRIVPDHGSRFAQLKSGEIDLMTDLNPDEAKEILNSDNAVRIVTTPSRRYQFIGWNNIDGNIYNRTSGKKIVPHPLFGDPRVRKAMTMAINRNSIINALMGQYAQESIGPVSPIFRYAYNDTLSPLPFDQASAIALLKEQGWEDRNNDGILEKDGRKFSFDLTIPAGSQFNDELAAIVQRQLHDIGIEVRIQKVEESVFWDQVISKKFDAFIGGFEVPLRLNLAVFWGSDLHKYPFNLVSFRDSRVDKTLSSAESVTTETDGASLWKEFQSILADKQPCTFLFWERNVIGMNKRIHGADISILGTTYRAWTWSVN